MMKIKFPKKKLILILFLAFNVGLLAQKEPNWTNPGYRNMKFPEEEYLIGYSQYKNQDDLTQEDFLEKLKGYSQNELVQSVTTTIQSASSISINEENDNYSELFKMSSVSTSGMDIAGLNFETYYNKRSKYGYAFAYARKDKVLAFYKGKLKKGKSKIQQKIQLARSLQNQQTRQLMELNSCYTEFRNVEEAQSIIYALKPGINTSNLYFEDFKKLKNELEKLKSSLEKESVASLDEVASLLSFTFKKQIPQNIKTVRLLNLSYQDTRMASPFSRRFTQTFEQKLNSIAGLVVISNIASQSEDNVNYLLTGTYWEEGEKIKIIMVLKDMKKGATVASAEAKLDVSWFTSNRVEFKPENFEQALATMKAFKFNDLKSSGLMVDFWTNKGDENIIFTKDETVRINVMANRECYIRIIYYFADGTKTLLLDNYFINAENVNKVYKLPQEFECAPPFGVETIQLNAQTEPFEKLKTEDYSGYEVIVEELDEILKKNRGIKQKKDAQSAEKRLIVTTMSN